MVVFVNPKIGCKDSCHKFLWAGNTEGGVNILLAECCVVNIFDVVRISDQIILKLAISKDIHTIISVYAPKSGRLDAKKDDFCDELHPVVAEMAASEILILSGDGNGHVGKSSAGCEGVHGEHGWGTNNTEGESLLEFAMSSNLVISNTCFKKTQINYVLLRKTFHKHVRDINVIPEAEIAKQHHLLVCDFQADITPPLRRNSSLA